MTEQLDQIIVSTGDNDKTPYIGIKFRFQPDDILWFGGEKRTKLETMLVANGIHDTLSTWIEGERRAAYEAGLRHGRGKKRRFQHFFRRVGRLPGSVGY